MSTVAISNRSAARAAGPAARLGAFFGTVASEWRARLAARRVDALSDEMLHDIGLTRGEIDSAVRHGRRSRGVK